MKKTLLAIAISAISFSSYAADVAAGEAKYKALCVACHGVDGKLGASGSKDISGKAADYIEGKLNDYRAGKVVSPTAAIMNPMAGILQPADVKNVAAYVATIK